MRVGDIEVVPVLDGQLIMAEPAGFPAEDSPEFVPHRDYISDGDALDTEVHRFRNIYNTIRPTKPSPTEPPTRARHAG